MKLSTPSDAGPTLAAVLRDAASSCRLSVYQIAKAAHVDQSTLNKFLSGKRDNLRLDVADRLFQFFELRVVSGRQARTRKK